MKQHLFIMYLIFILSSAAYAQQEIIHKGTMKVRKTSGNREVSKPVNMETYGSDRTRKDKKQRENLDRIRQRRMEAEKMKADSLKKTGGK